MDCIPQPDASIITAQGRMSFKGDTAEGAEAFRLPGKMRQLCDSELKVLKWEQNGDVRDERFTQGVRIQAELEAITNPDSLQQLVDRLESVSSWDELLTTRRRGRRRKKGR
jgi:hypothetical protein